MDFDKAAEMLLEAITSESEQCGVLLLDEEWSNRRDALLTVCNGLALEWTMESEDTMQKKAGEIWLAESAGDQRFKAIWGWLQRHEQVRVSMDAMEARWRADLGIGQFMLFEVGNEVFVRSGTEERKAGKVVDIECCVQGPDGSSAWYSQDELQQRTEAPE